MKQRDRGACSMKAGGKVGTVLHEFAKGKLHSGSQKGPVVKDRKQALAIGLAEQRRADQKRRG